VESNIFIFIFWNIIKGFHAAFLRTNTTSSIRFAENRSKAKITDFDFPLVAIDENVITLEISMDHRRIMAVQIQKPFQNLPTPMLNSSDVNPSVLKSVPAYTMNIISIPICKQNIEAEARITRTNHSMEDIHIRLHA